MFRLSHSWTFATIRLPCWTLPHFCALSSPQVIIVVISMVNFVTAVINTGNNINEAGGAAPPPPPPPPPVVANLFPQPPDDDLLLHVVATKSKPAQQIVHTCKDCYLAFSTLAQLKSHVRQVSIIDRNPSCLLSTRPYQATEKRNVIPPKLTFCSKHLVDLVATVPLLEYCWRSWWFSFLS